MSNPELFVTIINPSPFQSACGMLLIGSAVYMCEMFPQYGSEQDITNFTIVTIVVGGVTLAAGK